MQSNVDEISKRTTRNESTIKWTFESLQDISTTWCTRARANESTNSLRQNWARIKCRVTTKKKLYFHLILSRFSVKTTQLACINCTQIVFARISFSIRSVRSHQFNAYGNRVSANALFRNPMCVLLMQTWKWINAEREKKRNENRVNGKRTRTSVENPKQINYWKKISSEINVLCCVRGHTK